MKAGRDSAHVRAVLNFKQVKGVGGEAGVKMRILEPSYILRRENPNVFLKNLKGTRTTSTQSKARQERNNVAHPGGVP